MKRQRQSDQEISIWPLPPGAGRQDIYINPPGGRPPAHDARQPHFAAGTAHLVLLLLIGAALLITACGVAAALTVGAIW